MKTSIMNVLRVACLLLLASTGYSQTCEVSENGFYGQQDIRIPEIFDGVYFNYQIEYKESEFAANEDVNSMKKNLEVQMVRRVVNHSSIFPECSDPSNAQNADPSQTELPGMSSRPPDLVTSKECKDPPADNTVKCVVMQGHMTFFYPASRQDEFVPKLLEYNEEIRTIIGNGMDDYNYDAFHTIPGIHKVKYLTKKEYDNLPMKEGEDDDSESSGGDGVGDGVGDVGAGNAQGKGRSATTHIGLTFLSLTIISAALFAAFYVWKKKRRENAGAVDGSNANGEIL